MDAAASPVVSIGEVLSQAERWVPAIAKMVDAESNDPTGSPTLVAEVQVGDLSDQGALDKLRAGIDDRRRGPAGRRVNRSWRRVIGLLHASGTRRRGGAEPVRSWLDLLGLEGLGMAEARCWVARSVRASPGS